MADTELWGWHSFFEQIRNFLIDTSRHVGTSSEQYALYVVERMEVCISNVRNLREHLSQPPQQFGLIESEAEVVSRYHGELGELLLCLEAISMQWQEHSDRIGIETVVANNAYRVSAEPSGQGRGRPRLAISRDQLEYMASLSFTWTDIAAVLGVSRMTVYRRRIEFQMLQDPMQMVTDQELMRVLTEMRVDHPDYGETMAMGHLRTQGYRVTRQRLRRVVHITDPINVALRWRGGLATRRLYSVPGPNSLWHIGKLCSHCLGIGDCGGVIAIFFTATLPHV